MGKQAVNKTTAAEKAEAKAVAKVAKKMTGIPYVITNKETGITTRVFPHTFGDGFVSFADENLAGTPEWETTTEVFKFENPNNDGKLTSETYDIEVAPVEAEAKADKDESPLETGEQAVDDKYKGMKIAGRTILSSRLKDVHGRMLTEIALDTGETMLFSTEELDARLSPEN